METLVSIGGTPSLVGSYKSFSVTESPPPPHAERISENEIASIALNLLVEKIDLNHPR